MRAILPALIFSAAILTSSAADLVHAGDGSGVYGYKDTPKQPWSSFLVHDPDRPAPPRIDPGPSTHPTPAPSDAIVLFNGRDTSHWTSNTWRIVDGYLEAIGDVSPATKQKFGSFQLHLEWRAPANWEGPWYNRGNNGVLLHGLYEIQIFDSFNEKIYPDGQCAAVYAQTPPMVNVCRKPGEWESFDIAFTAPVFKGQEMVSPPRVTVFHNGVLVHHNQEVFGLTNHRVAPGFTRKVAEGPIALSGHGCPIQFRNIWLRPL